MAVTHKRAADDGFPLGGSGGWWSHPNSYTPNLTELIAPALGAGVGALGGAAVGKKGKKLKSALIGALGGGAAGGAAELALPGLGLGLKYTGQDTARGLYELLGGKKRNFLDMIGDHNARQHEMFWHYHNRGLPTNNFMYSYVPPGVKAMGKAGSAGYGLPLAGAGLGALVGALASDRGNLLRDTLYGAGVGGAGGLGYVAGRNVGEHVSGGPGAGGAIGGRVGGIGGALLAHALAQKTMNEIEYQRKRKKQAAGEKQARNMGLSDVPTSAGPDQITDALFRFNQLRSLVRPTDETLKGRDLSRNGFQRELRRIASGSQDKDRYELSTMAPNPALRAAIAGAAGLAGTGALTYADGLRGLGTGLAGTGLLAGGAYLHGMHQRNNFRNTAKLLKDYGLLRPQLLRQAYPLLGDDYRIS